ncbi:Isochorismatase-like protein [Mycena pura]|uniref:Isochorismatase-like protein n=1 Tax=Mycena pura TaxID=153505 RepID=A0AAD6V495_9AGAR|nr:Isochorismatase-like protein [Mycena pura]
MSDVDTKAATVLLLLNVQVGLVADPPQGIPAALTVRENITRVLEAARCAEHPPCIIHVRNCGGPGEPDEDRTPSWELANVPQPGEHVLDKRKNNAFSGTALDELIDPQAELIVVGIMSEYSIKSTCKVALDRGNTVLLIRGAHGTYNHIGLADGGAVTPAEKISAQVEQDLDLAGAIVLDMELLSGLFHGR